MKKKQLLLMLIIMFVTYHGCERDDICPESTPTTPNLIIDAFDADNQENTKNIFRLAIAGVGNNNVLPGYGIVTSSNLVLPLKADANSTQYRLIKEAILNNNGTPNDTTDDFIDGGNQDIITINYSRREIYVSRACGYKTIFENVTITLDANDTDKWIKSIIPLNPNQSVEDETTAHFNLFH